MTKTNRERILEYIWTAGPPGATNREINAGIEAGTQQSIYILTRELEQQDVIRDIGKGRTKRFILASTVAHLTTPGPTPNRREPELAQHEFEALARRVMGERFDVTFAPVESPDVRRRFALIAEEWRYAGDALYFGMPREHRSPMAKFALVSEAVWCLQQIEAKRRFLVCGGDPDVPERWLRRFGPRVPDVGVFFLSDNGELREYAGAIE